MDTATKTAPTSATNNRTWTAHAKFQEVVRALNAAFIEREVENDLLAIAAIAQVNLVFVGEPGIAKSAVQDGFLAGFDGPTFSILMHRSVGVEELLGNISLKELQATDSWRRNIKGRMPAARLAVTDEVFKSSPTSQTPQLKVMSERVYEVDGQWVPANTTSVFSASNEWPKQDDSGIDGRAFWDRYHIRKWVEPIKTEAGLNRLLGLVYDDDPADKVRESIGVPVFAVKLTPADLDQAYAESKAIRWSRQAGLTLKQLIAELAAQSVVVSDRRKLVAVKICQAAAWYYGSKTVEPEHLAVLAHVLWDDPVEDQAKVQAAVARVANPIKWAVTRYAKEIVIVEDMVNYDQDGSVQNALVKLDEIAVNLDALKDVQEVRDLRAELAATRSKILAKKGRRGFERR